MSKPKDAKAFACSERDTRHWATDAVRGWCRPPIRCR
jgi:hypothetical protein